MVVNAADVQGIVRILVVPKHKALVCSIDENAKTFEGRDKANSWLWKPKLFYLLSTTFCIISLDIHLLLEWEIKT